MDKKNQGTSAFVYDTKHMNYASSFDFKKVWSNMKTGKNSHNKQL